MLKFALKNMAIKKTQVILIILSIVISAGIAVLAFNVATQVDEGITSNAGYYSAIIGPVGNHTCHLDHDPTAATERINTLLAEIEYWKKENDRKAKIIDKFLG